jgi:hypothetical protein
MNYISTDELVGKVQKLIVSSYLATNIKSGGTLKS